MPFTIAYFKNNLTSLEAKQLLDEMINEDWNEYQLASIIGKFIGNTIQFQELSGFYDSLVSKMLTVNLDEENLIDIVGTGGDGKNTFNISTLACFVVAGAGEKVAKHCNYGASTKTGASNILEILGYNFSTSAEKLKNEIKSSNICFLHAPLFHPALKKMANVRRQIGLRTFFNLLGPLLNPAKPKFQLIGVSDIEVQRLYYYFLQDKNKQFSLIHCLNGYDEISLTNDTKIFNNNGEFILPPSYFSPYEIKPKDLSSPYRFEDLKNHFINVLKLSASAAQIEVVKCNAAIALQLIHPTKTYKECYQIAHQSLYSKSALKCFEQLIELQK